MGISFFARANILFRYIKIPGGLNWAQIIACVPLSLSSIFKWTLLAYQSPLRPDTHCRKLLVTGLLCLEEHYYSAKSMAQIPVPVPMSSTSCGSLSGARLNSPARRIL